MELKKRKRNSITPISHQLLLSSTLSTPSTNLYLPDECWESVFKFFNEADGNDIRYLKSLSLVSKQFLSITNRIRFSLTICDPTLPFLCKLFKRFTNLTFLNLTRFHGDLNKLLRQISCFPLNITSLNLSNKCTKSTLPFYGLQTFSDKITTLTSLKYSNTNGYSIDYIDLDFISDFFPLLEELDLSNPSSSYSSLRVNESLPWELFKLRKVNLSSQYYVNDQLLFHLFKNCKHLEEAIILVVDSMFNSRPSIRKIIAPHGFHLSDRKKKLFLHQGCINLK